nr:gliding motility-associated C-terminal domain-containing protein [Saprospiraceae bacterium]
SVFNESLLSNIICIENCPDYRLPNAFSPNGDGHNDIFKPYPFKFVNKVEFKVFNRWGNLIFETSDANLNWEGKTKSGNDVPDGVYYYTCRVFEQVDANGVESSPIALTGYIELIR